MSRSMGLQCGVLFACFWIYLGSLLMFNRFRFEVWNYLEFLRRTYCFTDSDSRRKKSKGQSKNKKSDKDKKKDKMTKSKASSKNTSSNQKSPLEERPNRSLRHENRRRDDSSSDEEEAERSGGRPGPEVRHKASRHRGRVEDAPPPTHERPDRADRGGHKDKELPRGRPGRDRDYEDGDRQPEARRHNKDDGGGNDGKHQAPQADRDRVRHRSTEKEKEPVSSRGRDREKERSKSRERSSRKEKDMDSSRDSNRNGVERQAERAERADKENRENRHHSDRYREPRRNEERSRDSSPRRRR